MVSVIGSQKKIENLQFANFQDRILPTVKDAANMYSSDNVVDIISERFYQEFIDLYNRFFPDNNEENIQKFEFMKDHLTEFSGRPKTDGDSNDSPVIVSIYRKGQTRYRLETDEEMEKRGSGRWKKSKRTRWFCEKVGFLKYTMIWNMMFCSPNKDIFTHEFEEVIYTGTEENEQFEQIELYLDAKIHAFFMERIINKRHPEHHNFSHYSNYRSTEHVITRGLFGILIDSSVVRFTNREKCIFVWLDKSKPFQDEMLSEQEIGLPIDFYKGIKIVEEEQEEEDIFLRIAEQWDQIYPNERFNENAKDCCKKELEDYHFVDFFRAYLDWEAARFQEIDSELGRLKKKQDDFLSPSTFCCFAYNNGMGRFQSVSQTLHAEEENQAALREATEILECYSETLENWNQLSLIKKKILALKRLPGLQNYSNPSFLDTDGQGTSLNMDRSLSRWDGVINRWHLEAGQTELNTMKKIAKFVNKRGNQHQNPLSLPRSRSRRLSH